MQKNMDEKKKKTKTKAFSMKFIAIYLFAMTILIAGIEIGLVLFWNHLDKYEKSLPENVAKYVFDEYFKELDAEKLFEFEKPFISEFETFDNYKMHLSSKTGDGECSFRNIPTGEGDIKKYAVFSGENRFAEFELIQKEKSGNPVWELSSLSSIFDWLESFDIVIPEGSFAYVNGNLVGEEYKSGSVVLGGIAGTQDRYTIDSLISEPAVEARYSDGSAKVLSYNGRTNEYSDICVVTVDILDGGKLYINGTEISDDYLIKEGIKTEQADRLNLSYKRYEITGSFGEPAVRAVNKSGKDGVLKDNGNMKFVQEIVYDNELEAEFGTFAKDAAMAYAKYMTNDSSLTELRKYFESGTATYEAIRTSEVIWYTKHLSYWFENITVSEFFEQDEGIFSCRVTFDHYIKRTETDTRLFPLDVTLFLRESGGKYLVFDMVSNA